MITVDDISINEIEELFKLTDALKKIEERPVKKVPLLQGTTVALFFSEPSTRTRLSFELAAKRLSADVISVVSSASSISKGETVEDTALVFNEYGVDCVVVRHREEGIPDRIADLNLFPVINAGDGQRSHPTQALLDAYTVFSEFGKLKDLKMAFVGDIRHSRVARSGIALFAKLGVKVFVVSPASFLPDWMPEFVKTLPDIDSAIEECDILYFLRFQRERFSEGETLNLVEFRERYALTSWRGSRLKPDTRIMHPGPVNRGVELDGMFIQHPQSLILKQVKNGLYVRMAILAQLLRGGKEELEISD